MENFGEILYNFGLNFWCGAGHEGCVVLRNLFLLSLALCSDSLNDFLPIQLRFNHRWTAMINCCAVPLFVLYYLDENCRNSLIHIKEKIVFMIGEHVLLIVIGAMIGWKVKEVEIRPEIRGSVRLLPSFHINEITRIVPEDVNCFSRTLEMAASS